MGLPADLSAQPLLPTWKKPLRRILIPLQESGELQNEERSELRNLQSPTQQLEDRHGGGRRLRGNAREGIELRRYRGTEVRQEMAGSPRIHPRHVVPPDGETPREEHGRDGGDPGRRRGTPLVIRAHSGGRTDEKKKTIPYQILRCPRYWKPPKW